MKARCNRCSGARTRANAHIGAGKCEGPTGPQWPFYSARFKVPGLRARPVLSAHSFSARLVPVLSARCFVLGGSSVSSCPRHVVLSSTVFCPCWLCAHVCLVGCLRFAPFVPLVVCRRGAAGPPGSVGVPGYHGVRGPAGKVRAPRQVPLEYPLEYALERTPSLSTPDSTP